MLGASFRGVWKSVDVLWGLLGGPWRSLGVIGRVLGVLRGAFGVSSREVLGDPLCVLGSPGSLWGSPGTWEELGGPLASFEILWGSLEVLWGPRGSLGGSLGVPCRSLMGHRLVLKIIEKRFVFDTFPSIEAPWGTPGRSLEVLGDSGAPLGVSWALSRASLGPRGSPWVSLGGLFGCP